MAIESRVAEEMIPFSALPLDASGPAGNAWGRFGRDDELGQLNLLTADNTRRAAQDEICSGHRISLDRPLQDPPHPFFGRRRFEHHIINRAEDADDHEQAQDKGNETNNVVVNDDELHFNTQCSSQWDTFRHYGNRSMQRYFNGVTHQQLITSNILGVDRWIQKGGIVGRGVLIDYAAWTIKHNLLLPPMFESSSIPFADLQRVIADQGQQFRQGDILIVRTGFGAALDALSSDDQQALSTRPPNLIGLQPCRELLEWLWEQQFAAVATDAMAFETSPTHNRPGADPEYELHQWLLAGWGMPIGELFDLEELSRNCQAQQRYSFFLTSVPLKVTGGVASPPNAIAIF